MAELFDFNELRLYRDKIVIAVAGAVDATFYAERDAPLVPKFDLMELANEFRHADGYCIDEDYREACLIVAARLRGVKCIPKNEASEFDPAAYHAETLTWARDILDKTQAGFSRRLFVQWGRQ